MLLYYVRKLFINISQRCLVDAPFSEQSATACGNALNSNSICSSHASNFGDWMAITGRNYRLVLVLIWVADWCPVGQVGATHSGKSM